MSLLPFVFSASLFFPFILFLPLLSPHSPALDSADAAPGCRCRRAPPSRRAPPLARPPALLLLGSGRLPGHLGRLVDALCASGRSVEAHHRVALLLLSSSPSCPLDGHAANGHLSRLVDALCASGRSAEAHHRIALLLLPVVPARPSSRSASSTPPRSSPSSHRFLLRTRAAPYTALLDGYAHVPDPRTAQKLLDEMPLARMLFVGDSLNRGQYVSLLCLLHRINDRIIRGAPMDKHSRFWKGADILVFNSYLWRGADDDMSKDIVERRVTGEVLGASRVPVGVVNITQLSEYRKDAHTQIYKKQWTQPTPE